MFDLIFSISDKAKNGFKHRDTDSIQNSDGDSLNLADSVPMRFGYANGGEGQDVKRTSSGVEKSMWGARYVKYLSFTILKTLHSTINNVCSSIPITYIASLRKT